MHDKGNIAKWYFYAFGNCIADKKMDLKNAWLSANPQNEFKNIIVLARSTRYNNPHIDYGFLKKYENIVFLGVESEYNLMKNTIPHLN